MSLVTTHAAGQQPVKDEATAHPVALQWRPVLAAVVRAFARGDLALSTPIPGVEPIPPDTVHSIRAQLHDYGGTLTELPHEAWQTSCAQWMGDRWDVLVDLWTEEEGPSDLVLELEVNEGDTGPRFVIGAVYVP